MEPQETRRTIALWGGIECTVNRVRDRFLDQLAQSGHAWRFSDLERCAALGIRALRYPILWERMAPQAVDEIDWHWSDQRLERLRELGILPIVGLVHHGSGPRYTSLVDAQFADKFARYAAAVADRYPWIEYYTPINEPLTTARFSGLYGVWYPHGCEPRLFWTALHSQCRAIVLAMAAIRRVNPNVKLVQTEDLGKTYSTPLLAYQAEFNNRLRWLACDLLCGKVGRDHPMWGWLLNCAGATEKELFWFRDHTCIPDLLGVNHYVTSQRFLDERLDKYPACFHGGNGRHCYADIEAARCLAQSPENFDALLLELWQRYELPLAITECHIDATRDDQLRWIAHMWRAAQCARSAGADIRAFTLWALFGAYDWNSLVTRSEGYYEPGAFDVRGPEPRATAIAKVARQLASKQSLDHPVLQAPGWWLRGDRFFCEPVTGNFIYRCSSTGSPIVNNSLGAHQGQCAPLLITGATGTLGNAFARICQARGLEYRLVSRDDLDIAARDSVERALDRHQPWGIINTAGYVRVDDAEREVERCFRENTQGPEELAIACSRHRLPLVTFSSDLVFDGRQTNPYLEDDQVSPLNVYGKSKAEAEKRVLDRDPSALVIRTSAFFGPWDDYNYVAVALRTLRQGQPFSAAGNAMVSPTYVPDLVHAALDLLIDNASGIWHLSNRDAVSWAELAQRAARTSGLDEELIQICRTDELNFLAPRPPYSVLGSRRGSLMPPLESALSRFLLG